VCDGGWGEGQATIEELCKHHESPLIFPLSNPTSRSEITAEDAYKWSKGKCLFAAGAPPATLYCLAEEGKNPDISRENGDVDKATNGLESTPC
jgi:hypothetical protein